MIDNILSNTKKATKGVLLPTLTISVRQEKSKTIITFEDNGKGLSEKIENIESIFEKGVTTTHGAGLGLYQVKNTIESLGGNVTATGLEKGFRLEVIFYEN